MHLSKRLQCIADMVTEGHTVIDVGCDHGYLPIYLIKEKRIPKAIAMDIVEGPLKRARENICANGLEEYIETRLSPGLDKAAAGEGQTLVIAGMGGPLMEQILAAHMDKVYSFKELILQPQSDVESFRHFLEDNCLEIVDENMILEEGKYYPIIKAVHGSPKPVPKEYYQYGPRLLQKKDAVLWSYLQREREKLKELEMHLKGQNTLNSRQRMEEIRKEMQWNQTAGEYYER